MLNYDALHKLELPEVRQQYTQRDTMLYALGLGFGRDPLDERHLRFVYEKDLVALPTMCVVLGSAGMWVRTPGLGIDVVKMVHGEQSIELHAPLPAAGEVVATNRVTHVVDKGAGKGGVVQSERKLRNAATGELIATSRSQYFCRADGGFATPEQPGDAPPAPIPALPDTAPHQVTDIATRPDQALVYRLSGDYNPLHAEPAVARKAGFDQPILHGLCTYGMVQHALLPLLDWDTTRLKGLRARFSSPVLPGDTLRVEIWNGGETLGFRVRAVERDVVVIGTGEARVVAR